MMTLWDEIKYLDDFYHGKLTIEDCIKLETQLILDEKLSDRWYWQSVVYRIIKRYGRKQLRKRLQKLENTLFIHEEYTSFVQKVESYFEH